MLVAEAQTRLGALALEMALEVPPGRCLALAGPSGAGKTTALRIVAGLARPDRGLVRLGDETWMDTVRGTWLVPERRRCGYVFQDYALFGHLRAWQNVAYPLRRLPRRERRRAAIELLDRLGAGDLADRRPAALSGGERQRVALARALALEPRVLLLDEPLAALDRRAHARGARLLGEVIRATAVPALLVTHDFAEAALIADDVAVLDHGRIVQRGEPASLAAAPASAFVADFTGAVVIAGVARPGGDVPTRVALDGGGELTSLERAEGPVAVSVYPWEVALEPHGFEPHGSMQNRLEATVTSLTAVAGRVRVGLETPQPLVAEVSEASARRLSLEPGARVVATWKAAATRLTAG